MTYQILMTKSLVKPIVFYYTKKLRIKRTLISLQISSFPRRTVTPIPDRRAKAMTWNFYKRKTRKMAFDSAHRWYKRKVLACKTSVLHRGRWYLQLCAGPAKLWHQTLLQFWPVEAAPSNACKSSVAYQISTSDVLAQVRPILRFLLKNLNRFERASGPRWLRKPLTLRLTPRWRVSLKNFPLNSKLKLKHWELSMRNAFRTCRLSILLSFWSNRIDVLNSRLSTRKFKVSLRWYLHHLPQRRKSSRITSLPSLILRLNSLRSKPKKMLKSVSDNDKRN